MNSSALIYAKALVAGAWLLSLAAGCSKSPTVDSAAATAELIEIVVGPSKLVRLKETARTNRTSTVLIERGTSGSPTQDTFLIVDAVAQLAAARKASYFINLKEWREPSGTRMYVIGLSNSRDVRIHEYFGHEYSLTNEYGQPRDFMSASKWISVRRDGPLPAPKDK